MPTVTLGKALSSSGASIGTRKRVGRDQICAPFSLEFSKMPPAGWLCAGLKGLSQGGQKSRLASRKHQAQWKQPMQPWRDDGYTKCDLSIHWTITQPSKGAGVGGGDGELGLNRN